MQLERLSRVARRIRPGSIALRSALLGALLVPVPALAAESGGDAELSGDEIARRVNARDEGESVSQTLVMELIDRGGQRRVRETRAFRRYYGAEKRTAIFFESPKNVKGTAFLTFDYPDPGRDDDQWLYLPALRKVRRISASNRGDSFFGTDFSYDDVRNGSRLNLADYTRRALGEQPVDGHRCLGLESIPVSDDVARELGYGRVVHWIDAERWMIRKAEMWDRRGDALKVVRTPQIERVQGIWTALRIEAENHKTGHRSIFSFRDTDYATGVDDDVFTERALRRGL
jgi:outer membrane lipoprotein-sorting protein